MAVGFIVLFMGVGKLLLCRQTMSTLNEMFLAGMGSRKDGLKKD